MQERPTPRTGEAAEQERPSPRAGEAVVQEKPLPRTGEAVDWWLKQWGREDVLSGDEPMSRQDR